MARLLQITLTALGAALPLSGCALDENLNGNGGDDSSNGNASSAPLAASEDNEPTIEAADARIEELLAQGTDVRTVCTQLVEMLQADERVAGSDVDPDLDAVWVDFVDGESQVFQIIDDGMDQEGVIDDTTFGPTDSLRLSNTAQREKEDRLVRQFNPPVPGDLYHLPANNKALLANALTPFHANWDVTDATVLVDFMLSGLGYDVTRTSLTLDVVDTLGDYAVVLLETHGTWRDPAYTEDIIQLPPEVGIEDDGGASSSACRGNGARHVLLTTTQVTGENLAPRGGDIYCGRLVIWNVFLRQPDGTVTKQAYYGVSAHYVREKITKFPDYTLFVLNACRAYQTDGVTGDTLAPFQDVLFDKTDKGAHFLGWNARVRYPYAYRAALNFFQIATVSDQEETVKNIPILESSDPPWGGFDPNVIKAWSALSDPQPSYAVDPVSGATLLAVPKPPETVLVTLMPHPYEALFFEDGQHRLELLADTAPDVRIGDVAASVTREPGTFTTWQMTVPIDAFGEMTVTEGELIAGVNRTVHRWRPQITISKTTGNLQYTVTLTLLARATITSGSLRTSPYDDPPAARFDTVWEREASFVAWQVSGQDTIDDFGGVIHVTYSGSGQRPFGDNDFGTFETEDGTTAIIDVVTQIPYTETRTDSQTNESTSTQESFDLILYRSGVALSPEWTVREQDFTEDIGQGDARISWSAFSAEPPFDSSEEPR